MAREPIFQLRAMPGSTEREIFLDPDYDSSAILITPLLDGMALGARERISDDADRQQRFGTPPFVPPQEIENHAGYLPPLISPLESSHPRAAEST
ncbi:hypothetical protein GCM10025762_26300 [Haloechinothrix salitolerans]